VAVAVPRRATLRVVVWAFHLALPLLLGLWLLLAHRSWTPAGSTRAATSC
jgi:hypothetical protein